MASEQEFTYRLFRFSSKANSTLGLLMADSEPLGFRCFTLEDEYREIKVPGKTRIPAGRYEIKFRTEGGMHTRYLNRFDFHQGMLELQDVPDFKWIYIHPGNRHEHTEGCILTGDGAQSNVIDDGAVTSSVSSYERLYKEIVQLFDLNKRVFIAIEDVA